MQHSARNVRWLGQVVFARPVTQQLFLVVVPVSLLSQQPAQPEAKEQSLFSCWKTQALQPSDGEHASQQAAGVVAGIA